MPTPLLEICVDTIQGAHAAIAGGANRIELCSSLSEGGLTPSAGLMQAAAQLPIPCYAMIRPRPALFHFAAEDEAIMHTDITKARQAGLAGVVLGAQSDEDTLDTAMLQRLSQTAGSMGRTLHRVIDVVPDPLKALDQAVALGFERVLTSGAASEAPDGTELIAQMVRRAAGRLSVMPGCGLTAANVAQVLKSTGATEVHAACRHPAPGPKAFSDFDPPGGRYETSEAQVCAMAQALARL